MNPIGQDGEITQFGEHLLLKFDILMRNRFALGRARSKSDKAKNNFSIDGILRETTIAGCDTPVIHFRCTYAAHATLGVLQGAEKEKRKKKKA